MKKITLMTALAFLALTLAGCGGEQGAQQGGEEPAPAGEETTLTPAELDDEETAGELTEQEPVRANDGTTVAEGVVGGEQVDIGGFVVEVPEAPEVEVPRVTTTQEDVLQYYNEVRPVIGEGSRGVSEALRPEARVENGRVELGVDVAPVREARQAAQQNLERLRQVEPPEGLEPIQAQLVDSYERALPAYDNIIEAFDSGDPEMLQEAVQENLPLIEQYNAVERGILQDLQEATPEQTGDGSG